MWPESTRRPSPHQYDDVKPGKPKRSRRIPAKLVLTNLLCPNGGQGSRYEACSLFVFSTQCNQLARCLQDVRRDFQFWLAVRCLAVRCLAYNIFYQAIDSLLCGRVLRRISI